MLDSAGLVDLEFDRRRADFFDSCRSFECDLKKAKGVTTLWGMLSGVR